MNNLDKNSDKVIEILLHTGIINPQKRITTDQCLGKGCDDGIFRKRCNGNIVDVNISEVDSGDG